MLKKFHFNLAYYRHPPWDTGVTPPELIEFIDSHSPGTALDLGCGTGTNAIYQRQDSTHNGNRLSAWLSFNPSN